MEPCALIMAGGSGQRFWPLSTSERPKQMLTLFSDKSMIRETVDRLSDLMPPERIFIGTNIVQAKGIKEQLPMLPEDNVIIEPAFKDTAAAVGYGARFIGHRFPGAQLIVLASDHLIQDVGTFIEVLKKAVEEAESNKSIVTLGLKPTRPETGYGYIQLASMMNNQEISDVSAFCEKPDLETAEAYLADGRYLWNSGMFVFDIQTILAEMEEHMPEHHATMLKIQEKIDMNLSGEALAEATKVFFDEFKRISIDFGIMEKSNRIKVIPCDIGWNDIGSFLAFEDVLPKNEHGSIVQKAKAKEVDSANNIIYLEGDEIALIGVTDLVVVKSEGKLLIAHKDHLQDIKKIF